MKTIVCILLFVLISAGCNHIPSKNTQQNSNQQRDFTTLVNDRNIQLSAINAMFKHDSLWENSDIEVVSFNRVVLLIGQTPTKTLKQKAGEIVKTIPDVRRVFNEIRVAAPTSTLTYLSDVSLTSKVKTTLFIEDDLDSTKIKVVTEDGEVFLLGFVSADEAKKAVELTRNVSGVKRVIQAFEITTPSGR